MTGDLRERVIAMADNHNTRRDPRDLALAVAEMVAEECAKTCDNFGWYGFIGERCAAAIRQRAEGLR